MLFKELEGKEIIDVNGERIGFVKDIVFTTTGRVTHIIGMPKGVINKMKMGQLNIQFEDVASIEDVMMLNKSEDALLGRTRAPEPEPTEAKAEKAPIRPKRLLLKKKKK